MPISHYAFLALHLDAQMLTLWAEGTFLASRWEEEDAVNLYHVGSFFCEVYYSYEENRILRTRTFTSQECLMDYTAYIDLGTLGLDSEG